MGLVARVVGHRFSGAIGASFGFALLTTSVAAIQLVSVADEIAIGKQAQAQVKRETPALSDATVQAYVARLGRTLAAHARGQRYPYSFSIANYREINAFALPGGPIWVNRGAIEAARTEAQLAGVVAHEIAHISQRHAASQLSNAMVTNLGLSLLGALLGNSGGAAPTSPRAWRWRLSQVQPTGGRPTAGGRDHSRAGGTRTGHRVMNDP